MEKYTQCFNNDNNNISKLQQKKTEREENKKEKKRMKEERRNLKKELFALKHPVITKILSYIFSLSFEDALFYIIVFLAIAFFAVLLLMVNKKEV